jgi:hypothetical protein
VLVIVNKVNDYKTVNMVDNNNTTQMQNITPAERPELKSDQSWYSSAITQLLAPLVGTRYIWLTLEEINPFNFLGKTPPKLTHDEKVIKYGKDNKTILNEKEITPYKESSFGRYASRNFAAYGMGAGLFLLMGIYSRNTLNDVKSLYAEAVGYELGKNSKDVTTADVFIKSQNEAVKVTCNAYLKRSLVRFGTAATFFVPWQKFRSKPFQYVQPKYDVNADAGVGAIGALIYGEGFLRKPSFFDIEQKLVSTKINHKDIDPYTAFQPQDIQALINLHRKHLDKHYKAPSVASKEGQHDVALANRIAELLNIAYDNKPEVTNDKLTIGKLNYLIGFNLLEKFPEALAFVELANKSQTMEEVKQAASAISNGEVSQSVFARFGVDMQKLATQPEQQAVTAIVESKQFTKDIAPKELMEHAAKQAETSAGRTA